jgi:hypothetical protein
VSATAVAQAKTSEHPETFLGRVAFFYEEEKRTFLTVVVVTVAKLTHNLMYVRFQKMVNHFGPAFAMFGTEPVNRPHQVYVLKHFGSHVIRE